MFIHFCYISLLLYLLKSTYTHFYFLWLMTGILAEYVSHCQIKDRSFHKGWESLVRLCERTDGEKKMVKQNTNESSKLLLLCLCQSICVLLWVLVFDAAPKNQHREGKKTLLYTYEPKFLKIKKWRYVQSPNVGREQTLSRI